MKKTRTKITPEIITKICDMYKNGMSQSQITKELNLGGGTVSKYLKLNNINTSYIKDKVGQQIIEKYLNGSSMNQLGKEYGYKPETISKYLKNHNVEIRSPFKFNLKQKEQICEDYICGMSEEKLAYKYDSNRTTIRNVLKELDVRRRDNSEYRTYALNENYFHVIDSQNKAYILGFLYADGNVSKRKYNIQLSLQKCDVEILEKIKEELGSTAPLEYRNFSQYNEKYNIKTQDQWALNLHCKQMWYDLCQHGVVPNKTHDIIYPQFLTEDLHKHFIRGVLDGDGCIHPPSGKNGKLKYVDICGTQMFCEGIKSVIENVLHIHCSIIKTSPDPNKTTYRITVSGGIQVSKFLDWIYEDATLKLERKYQLYLKHYCNNKSVKTA